MNIALPILLLVFGGLSFWILTESKVKWYIKTSCISVFCIFTVIFWTSIHTFLGWPASQKEMPEKALLHTFRSEKYMKTFKYFKSPSLDVSCGDGVYSFFSHGGELSTECDQYQSLKKNSYSLFDYLKYFL